MGEFELNEKAKTEFLNLPVIKSNFVSCWFDGQKLVMLSGQGKTLKGVVLASLEVFKSQQSKIEQLEKQQRINSECINNLVKQKADYLYKVTKAIAHLDSFDHSRAEMNQLVRSIESALEALRGECE